MNLTIIEGIFLTWEISDKKVSNGFKFVTYLINLLSGRGALTCAQKG